MITSNLLKRTLTHFMKSACQSSRYFVSATKLETKNLQEIALDENCILVDELDRPLGQSTKRDCHRVGPNGDIKLHRAFSVFLFNSHGDMLIQKRASQKVYVYAWMTMMLIASHLYRLSINKQQYNLININFVIYIDYISRLLYECMLQSSIVRHWRRIRRNQCNGHTQSSTASIKLWTWNTIQSGML